MTKLLIVHLSDIHFETSRDIVLGRADAIAAAATSTADTVSRAMVVVTGDVAFSGKAGQYGVAESFLAEVSAAITSRIQKPVDVVVVPGRGRAGVLRGVKTAVLARFGHHLGII